MGCLRLVDRWRYKRSSELRVVHVKKGVASNDWIKRVRSSYLFGMLMPGRHDEINGNPYTYGFNGMERDEEVKGAGNSYDFGARMHDPRVGRFLSLDPSMKKYPAQSPYNFVFNSPLMFKDADGKDGILVVFPDYKIDPELQVTIFGKTFKSPKLPLGHAGVLLIDNETGYTKYYEYGRYSTEDGTRGKVRNVAVPNVVIGEDGKPTPESLNNVFKVLSEKVGQGGRIEGTYIESDQFKAMNDYATQKFNESNDPENPDYNKDRKSYNLYNNNCATFGCDVLKQDPEIEENAPWILNPSPDNVAEEYQDNFTPMSYDPETNTTTVEDTEDQ